MDLYTFLILGHLVGTVLGVGGATMIEVHLKKALSDGSMSLEERKLLGSDFFVTRVGLALAILTGLGFIYVYWSSHQLFRLESGIFWGKMAMIVVILVNAYLLHKHKIGLYWGSALSFVSWWTAFLAGFFLTQGIKIYPMNPLIEFLIVIGGYLLAVTLGAAILHRIREYGKSAEPKASAATPVSMQKPKSEFKEPIVQTADEALGRTPPK